MTCVRSRYFFTRFNVLNNWKNFSHCQPRLVFSNTLFKRNFVLFNAVQSKSDLLNESSSPFSVVSGYSEPRKRPSFDNEIDSIKNKVYSKDSLQDLLELVCKEEDQLNTESVMAVVNRILALHRHQSLKITNEEVLNSKSFLILFKNVQKCITKLEADELVNVLNLTSILRLPNNSVIVLQILKLLLDEINNLSLYKALLAHKYVRKNWDNKIAQKLKLGLETVIPIFIKEKLESCSPVELSELLLFGRYASIPNDQKISIAKAALSWERPLWGNPRIPLLFINLLSTISKDYSDFPQIERRGYIKIKEYFSKNVNVDHAKDFLNSYAFFTKKRMLNYSKSLLDTFAHVVSESNASLHDKASVLMSLSNMKHVHFHLIDQVRDLILADIETFNEDETVFYSFIKALALSNYSRVMGDRWLFVRSFIGNSRTLSKETFWERKGLYSAFYLASLGIFPDPLLKCLSERYGPDYDFGKLRITDCRMLLNLHQGVSVLHPSFSQPILSEETFNIVFAKVKEGVQFEQLAINSEITKILASEAGGKNFVFENCFTKLGHEIDAVVAINDAGEPVPLGSYKEDVDLCVEHISLPPDYKLVLVLMLREDSCCRNVRVVGSPHILKIRSLEAMGYMVVPVFQEDFKELDEREKGPFLWRQIKDKCSLQSSESFSDSVNFF